jgi:hypothetical protein
MATAPTPEESARNILAIFKHHNVQTDEVLLAGALNIQFINAGGSPADYEAGMGFAIQNGWLEQDGMMVRLNAAGFAEM